MFEIFENGSKRGYPPQMAPYADSFRRQKWIQTGVPPPNGSICRQFSKAKMDPNGDAPLKWFHMQSELKENDALIINCNGADESSDYTSDRRIVCASVWKIKCEKNISFRYVVI